MIALLQFQFFLFFAAISGSSIVHCFTLLPHRQFPSPSFWISPRLYGTTNDAAAAAAAQRINSHSNTITLLRATTSCSIQDGQDDDDDNNIHELYKTVAEQDPEWYQEFVLNVLGEDDTSMRVLPVAVPSSPSIQNETNMLMTNEESTTGIPDDMGETKTSSTTIIRQTIIDTKPSNDNDNENEILQPETLEESNNNNKNITGSKNETTNETIQATNNESTLIDEEDSVMSTIRYTNLIMDTSGYYDSVNETNEFVSLLSMEESLISNQDDSSTFTTTTAASNEVSDSRIEIPSEILSTTNATATTPPNTAIEPEFVILYRDFYKQDRLQCVPLQALVVLGYTPEEIPFLQTDVLSLIIQDSIERPTRGIPPQWKISQSQYQVLKDDVRIMYNDEAQALLLEKNKSRRTTTTTTTPSHVGGDKVETVLSSRDDTFGDINERKDAPLPQRQRRPSSSVLDEPESNTSTRTRSRPPDRKQQQRPPVTASSSKRRPDPPRNPLWMDIDTFRDLLKREAELRVRILGEGWSETIKRESSWRLRLYKEWLWNLHDGVGEPFFQSESERVRRKEVMTRRDDEFKSEPMRSRRTTTDRARVRSDPNKRILDPRAGNRPGKSQSRENETKRAQRRNRRENEQDDE